MSQTHIPSSHSAVHASAGAHPIVQPLTQVSSQLVPASQSCGQPVSQSIVQLPESQFWAQPPPSQLVVHESPSQSCWQFPPAQSNVQTAPSAQSCGQPPPEHSNAHTSPASQV